MVVGFVACGGGGSSFGRGGGSSLERGGGCWVWPATGSGISTKRPSFVDGDPHACENGCIWYHGGIGIGIGIGTIIGGDDVVCCAGGGGCCCCWHWHNFPRRRFFLFRRRQYQHRPMPAAIRRREVPPKARWSNLISKTSWCASVSTVRARSTGALLPEPIFELLR